MAFDPIDGVCEADRGVQPTPPTGRDPCFNRPDNVSLKKICETFNLNEIFHRLSYPIHLRDNVSCSVKEVLAPLLIALMEW